MPSSRARRRDVVGAEGEEPEHIIWPRLGDFGEACEEDAQVVARALGRGVNKYDGMALCGVPYHAINEAIATLEGRGFRVELLPA